MLKVVHYIAEDGTDYFDERLQNQARDIEMAQACCKAYQQEEKKCP